MTDAYDIQNLRSLPVDLSELEYAAESHDSETRTFVDRETGAVVAVLDSSFTVADEHVSSQTIAGDISPEMIEQLADDHLLPAWQVDDLDSAFAIALDTAGRCVQINPRWSSDAFRDRQDFTETVENAEYRRRLENALGGRGSFRRFGDAIDEMPDDIRQRWFAFRDARVREYIVDWLRGEGIEPIDTPAYRGPNE